jgi:F0F1-type ATP synthase assembly protein I
MEEPKNSRDSFLYTFGIYSTVGIQLVISVVLGSYAGSWGDKKLGTDPWLMILGIVLGTAAGFYNLFRLVSKKEQK